MTTSTDPLQGRAVWRRAFDWLLSRRPYTNGGASQISGGGQKLRPITEILARTGREPHAPE